MDRSRKQRAELHYIQGEREPRRLSDELVTFHDPLDSASEAYRMLRTNLFYAMIDESAEVIVLTSPGLGEGKSTTCANLAVTLAQAGRSVLLVDCDLRKPAQHRLFGVANSPGLVDILAGARSLQGGWQGPLDGLKLVPAGHVPPNPSEILSSRRFAEFLARVRQEFDYVLLDTPPVCAVSDPAIVAKQGDGVLLVMDFQNTSKRPLRQALDILDGVGANVIGTVTNKVRIPKDSGIYGYGHYGVS